MRKIKLTYSLFLEPSFIEDYLFDVKLPSPHIQFEYIFDVSYFRDYKEGFSNEEEKEFLEKVKQEEMDSIKKYPMDCLFNEFCPEPYEQLLNLLESSKRENINEILAYADAYFDETKSNVEFEFVE